MDNKIILITGANRGIGDSILHRLDADGYLVVGSSRSNEGVEKITSEIKKSNGKGIQMDVTDQKSIENR